MGLTLDTTTLFISLSLVYTGSLIFSIVLYVSRQIFPGVGSWITAQALLLAGTVASVLRVFSPPFFGIVLPNTALLVSTLFTLNAVWLFRFAKRMPWQFWLIAPVFFVVFLCLEYASINIRIVVWGGASGLICIFTGLVLFFKVSPKLRFSSYVMGTAMVLTGLANLIRIPPAVTGPLITSVSFPGPVNSIVYLLSMFCAFFMLFGYFLMSGIRFEQELREKEAAIEKQNRALVRLNKTKVTLLSVIAHDLRVPISGAARYVKKFLLPDDVDLNEKKKALAIVSRTLSSAEDLLANLMAWAQNESDEELFRKEPVSFANLIAAGRSQVLDALEQKNIELVVDPSQDCTFLAHLSSAETVLRNLLSNAVKFTNPGGKIQVSCFQMPDAVCLSVSDNGVGMDEDLVSKLLREEETNSLPGTAGERGNGLGLSLCHGIMHRHGGSLLIESRPGEGSVFTAVFPRP